MIRQSIFLLSASLLAMAGAAHSATFTVTPVFSNAYLSDFSAELPEFDPNTYDGPPVVLQVDFWLSYEGSEGTFGAVVFDIDLDNLIVDPAIPGWQGFNPTVDAAPMPGGNRPFYANNSDLGVPYDLKYITVGIASGITTNPLFDPRLKVGQGAGITWDGVDIDVLGSLYVDWAPDTSGEISVMLREAGYRRPSDGLLFVDSNPTLIGNTLRIGPPPAAIPEPASLAMAGLGTLVLGFFYCRQNSRANHSPHS